MSEAQVRRLWHEMTADNADQSVERAALLVEQLEDWVGEMLMEAIYRQRHILISTPQAIQPEKG